MAWVWLRTLSDHTMWSQNHLIHVGHGVTALASIRTRATPKRLAVPVLEARSWTVVGPSMATGPVGGGVTVAFSYLSPPVVKAFTNCVSHALLPSNVSTPVLRLNPARKHRRPTKTTMLPTQKLRSPMGDAEEPVLDRGCVTSMFRGLTVRWFELPLSCGLCVP